MKKCLIIVPHPDDEINIAGCIFDQLKKNGYVISVMIVTYGDYYPELAAKRVQETLKAKKILGYNELIFLGYGDDYKTGHLYEDTCGETIYESHAGYLSTYVINDIKPYHFRKYNKQAQYTRNNLKYDIKNIIIDMLPELLICNDVDNHPDHKAISLLFDEVMGEILKENDYYPTILKKFAYLGVYKGPNDYYNKNNRTRPCYFNEEDESFAYPYIWNERIIIRTNESLYPMLFWKSDIFKALCAHKSQRAYAKFGRIVNSDVIYWHRRTDNLALKAKVLVSSGDSQYINDFKIVDTDDIKSTNPFIIPSNYKLWKPDKDDVNPRVKFVFDQEQKVSTIRIYQNPNSKINKVDILIDNNKVFLSQFSNCNNTITIKFENILYAKELLLLFETGSLIEINEIEIFEKKLNDKFSNDNIIKLNNRSIFWMKFFEYIYNLIVLYSMSLSIRDRLMKKILFFK